MSERLCVVMPVYNEQDAIGPVLEKWDAALNALGIDYEIRPYNDGSRDSSLEVMRRIAAQLGKRVNVHDKPNGGHGNTILTGYRAASIDGFDWIFQIDSDDEMGPEKFIELWSKRNEYDFLVGIRDGRKQALPRKVISFVSRLCVRIFYGKSIWDVNTPYRLMRVSAFKEFYMRIPLSTFAPNVILSGLAARYKLRCFETRVPQHDRTTGEVSIKKWKLLKAAAKSFGQTILFAFITARLRDWLRYVVWMLAWGFAGVCVIVGFRNGFREFDFQWDPAKVLMLRDNPYVYSLEHKAVPYEGFINKQIGAANQLPSCLLLLAPWTFFPQLLANQIWDVCNLLFTVVFLIFVYKAFFAKTSIQDSFFWVPLLLLAGSPWRGIIGNGQHLMFSLAFFMPAYYYAQKRKTVVSGILLALSAFKYTTIAPLSCIFVSKGWWKQIIIAAAIHIIATIGCGLYLSESPITLICQSLKVSAGLTAQGYADWASIMASLGSPNVNLWANIGYVVFAILLVTVCVMRHNNDTLLLSVFAVVANVMFYHRSYDFVVLLFPFIYMLENWKSSGLIMRSVKILVILNIVWAFWGHKGFSVLQVPVNLRLVYFILQHAMLIVFLCQVFCLKAERRQCEVLS